MRATLILVPLIYLKVLWLLMSSYVSPHSVTFSIAHTASSLISVKANTELLNLRGYSSQMH